MPMQGGIKSINWQQQKAGLIVVVWGVPTGVNLQGGNMKNSS
jgi:hypothetical protein